MKQIILISGKAQHGKDYFATHLKERLLDYEKHSIIIHYADYLKYLCKEYFGWDGLKNDAGRNILQYVGTDVIRNKVPDFWVRNVIQLIDVLWNEYDYALIPDTRFPNEIDSIRTIFYSRYVTSLKIERFNESGFPFENSLNKTQRMHQSETALDSRNDLIDFTVSNFGGGISGIEQGLRYTINHLKEKQEKYGL